MRSKSYITVQIKNKENQIFHYSILRRDLLNAYIEFNQILKCREVHVNTGNRKNTFAKVIEKGYLQLVS